MSSRHIVGAVLAFAPALVVAQPHVEQCIDRFAYLSESAQQRGILPPSNAQLAPRLGDVRAGITVPELGGRQGTPYLKPRAPVVRPNIENLRKGAATFERIVVKFRDDSLAQAAGGRLELPGQAANGLLGALASPFEGFEFAPDIGGGDDWLTAVRFCAASNTGSDFADLTAYFSAPIPPKRQEQAIDLLEALLLHPEVETAWLRPPIRMATFDIPPTTPSLDAGQRHLDSAPVGINLRSSWGINGTKGAGLRYVDIDGDWTVDHEDFPVVATIAPLSLGASGHGTAVVGILSAVHNGFGVMGGVPDGRRPL